MKAQHGQKVSWCELSIMNERCHNILARAYYIITQDHMLVAIEPSTAILGRYQRAKQIYCILQTINTRTRTRRISTV